MALSTFMRLDPFRSVSSESPQRIAKTSASTAAPIVSKSYYSEPDQSYPYYTIYDDDVSIYKDDGTSLCLYFKGLAALFLTRIHTIAQEREAEVSWIAQLGSFILSFFCFCFCFCFFPFFYFGYANCVSSTFSTELR
jgi:hypothetical protein